MYDIFTNPVVGYLRPGFFCVNFMVPGPMTGFIHLGDAVGGNWAENELFQQIKTSQSLTTKSVERGGKHHLVEESPRINTIFSETTHFFWGIMESWYRLISLLKWHHWWFWSLEGPTDRCTWTFGRAQTTSPDLLGSRKGETRSWKVEGEAHMVGNLWLENFQIPKILIVWVKWQLTH